MVMSRDPEGDRSTEHRALTRRFIVAIFVLIMGCLVGLGLLAVRYAATSATEQAVLLGGIVACLLAAAVGGVFAARFARRIGRLSRQRPR